MAKRKNWRKFCEVVENAPELYRLGRILNKYNSFHLSCLRLPNGEYTKSVEESLLTSNVHPFSRVWGGFYVCSFSRDRTQSGADYPESDP